MSHNEEMVRRLESAPERDVPGSVGVHAMSQVQENANEARESHEDHFQVTRFDSPGTPLLACHSRLGHVLPWLRGQARWYRGDHAGR